MLHVADDGKLYVKGKVRGRNAAIEQLAASLENRVNSIGDQPVFIVHGDCLEDAEALEKIIRDKYGVKEVVINCLDPVIASHAGPGTLAIFYVGEQR